MAQRDMPIMDVADYLLLDESSTRVRYELLDGEVRMLAGEALTMRLSRRI